MYNIIKVGADIYLTPWVKLNHNPNKDRVYFLAENRNPHDWVPSVVSANDQKSHQKLRDYVKALPENKRGKWEKFDEQICALAIQNNKMLRQKGVQILNEKFRNQTKGSSMDEYLIASMDTKYESGCWNCKGPVDSEWDLKHRACGWLICGHCGACGCGYQK